MSDSDSRNDQRISTRRDFLIAGGAAAALASVGAAPPVFAQAGVKRLRLAHPAPTAHGWHIWSEFFKKSIEDKSAGKMTVQIFPNAQMGNERDTAQAVRIGSIEMGAIGVGLMNWVPEMSITDAPFLWKSRAQAWRAIEGAFGDDLRKRSLDKGFKLVGWCDLGFRSMTNNKRPINSAKDMQGLKMRVPNSKAYIQMIQAMGATTVAVFHTHSGRVFATQPECPHKQGPLADGLVGGTTVVCPLHERAFSLETGEEAGIDCRLVIYPARITANATIAIQMPA